MSISGSDEAKTAILRVNGVEPGTTKQTAIDAQEDREILGVEIDAAADQGVGQVQSKIRAFIGTDPQPGADEAIDNRSFYVKMTHEMLRNDTEGLAFADDSHSAEWYGDNSGVEWNEDSTLTLEVNNVGSSTSVDSAEVKVYYREL